MESDIEREVLCQTRRSPKLSKKEFGVSHGFANTIVKLSQDAQEHPEDLLSAQYKGKESLLPIYKALVSMMTKFGEEVKVSPKKTSVSIIRKRQFALIKPSTKTRIDLGLKFNDKEIGDRWQNSGPFGTMCTHRVQLSDLNEVDEELKSWLVQAYQEAG